MSYNICKRKQFSLAELRAEWNSCHDSCQRQSMSGDQSTLSFHLPIVSCSTPDLICSLCMCDIEAEKIFCPSLERYCSVIFNLPAFDPTQSLTFFCSAAEWCSVVMMVCIRAFLTGSLVSSLMTSISYLRW
jgi:hypothetical protein